MKVAFTHSFQFSHGCLGVPPLQDSHSLHWTRKRSLARLRVLEMGIMIGLPQY